MADAYFVTCYDAGRTAMILGPFFDEKKSQEYAYVDPADNGNPEKHRDLLNAISQIDPKSHFYAFGMCRVPSFEMCPFNYRGVLNRVHPEIWDKVIS